MASRRLPLHLRASGRNVHPHQHGAAPPSRNSTTAEATASSPRQCSRGSILTTELAAKSPSTVGRSATAQPAQRAAEQPRTHVFCMQPPKPEPCTRPTTQCQVMQNRWSGTLQACSRLATLKRNAWHGVCMGRNNDYARRSRIFWPEHVHADLVCAGRQVR